MDSLKGLKENDRKLIWEHRYTAISNFPESIPKVLLSCQCFEPNATGQYESEMKLRGTKWKKEKRRG
jgi:hypothetical protein